MAGLYFHIPFCKTRCLYCDFFSSTSMQEKEYYVNALCRELNLQKNYLEGEPVSTIYFGGGTPSQLSPKDLREILKTVTDLFQQDQKNPEIREITLEANPDDITLSYLDVLIGLGFNRISIGIQSFQDRELRFLNRRHDAAAAIQAVRNCQSAGFTNISIDLMYGLPGQTLETWEENLKQAIALNVQHISAYHLIYEEGTPLFRLLEKGEIVPVDEELSVRMFECIIDRLAEAGFEQYEISNFARRGYRSRHNSSYWDGTHYLGIGASAHSYNGKSRQWNIASIPSYINEINQGKIPMEPEEINHQSAYNDYIITRMRTREGVNLKELIRLFGEDKKIFCLKQAHKHIENKALALDEDRLHLTREGIFVSDGIMSDLMYMDEV